MKKLIVLATALFALAAGPACAGPLAGAAAWLGGVLAGSGAAAALAKIAVGIGLNLIASAIMRKVAGKPETNVTFDVQIGDDKPLSFVVGDYATAGRRKYIGEWGPNSRYVTDVIEVSALPQGLAGMWVNDEPGDIQWSTTESFTEKVVVSFSEATDDRGRTRKIPVYGTKTVALGHPVTNLADDGNRIWIRYHDGTQTTADELLTAVFGDDEDYPWTSDFVGKGKAYVVVTTRYDSDTLTSYPSYLWQPAPLPMYDPRKDSTAGGSGSHRWGTRSTYEVSRNPAVIAYNIARGVYYGTEWVYGGRNLDAWRLPIAEWFAAMNACDTTVSISGGGTEPAYRCGAEVSVDMEPAGLLEEIGRAANMRFAEVGGRLKPLVDLPATAVFSITDDDIIITEGQSYSPFFPVSETYNAIQATYPEPGEKWAAKDAPEYADTAATTADQGRYLPVSVSYGACPYKLQVQRLMRSQIQDYRRMRRHQFALPPDAYALEAGDLINWSSQRNGYENKKFIVEQVTKLAGFNVTVAVREVDPSDYDWSPSFQLPTTVITPANPIVLAHPAISFTAIGVEVTDTAGKPRAAGIQVSCSATEVGIKSVQIQVRKLGSTDAEFDVTRSYTTPHAWLLTGVVPDTAYQVRGRLIPERDRGSIWSTWISVTTPSIAVVIDDVSNEKPNTPTGLTLTSALTSKGARLTATWTAPSSVNGVRTYDIRIREGSGNNVAFSAPETRYQWDVLPGVTYTVSVRATDRFGNLSNWTVEATHTVVADNVPPATPTGLTATAGTGSIWLNWNANSEADFARYELYESSSSTPAPTTSTAANLTTPATAMARSSLPGSTTYHYWIRAVDTSGNKSGWSSRVQATTAASQAITTEDLIGAVDRTSFASNVKPIEVVTTLPGAPHVVGRMVFLTGDQKLYRNTGSAWTRAVDGADLTANSIDVGVLRAGVVRSTELATDALTARHMFITDFSNLVLNNWSQGTLDGWSLSSSSEMTLVAVSGARAGTGIRADNSSGWINSPRWTVRPEEEYYFEVSCVRSNALGTPAGNTLLQARWYHSDDSITYSNIGGLSNATTGWVWQKIAGTAIAPAGAIACSLWIRPMTSSGSGRQFFAFPIARKMAGGELIVDGALQARHLTTDTAVITDTIQIKNSIIEDAHIVRLAAAKLYIPPGDTGIPASITVGTTGTSIGVVESRAANPAARINAASTQIDPGKIVISGSTTLADWRSGADQTRIDGGVIYADTVKTNSLEVGARNLVIAGIEFECNASANRLDWTSGTIRIVDDGGSPATYSISSGNVVRTSGTVYVYWTKGGTSLQTTTTESVAFASNRAVIATYVGGLGLVTNFGRTIINGSKISTGSIDAEKLNVTELSAITGNVGTLNAGVIRSPNYVAGLSGGMFNLNTGALEVNSIFVREGSMAAGAAVVGDGDYQAAVYTVTTSMANIASATITCTSGKVLVIFDLSLISNTSNVLWRIRRGTTTLRQGESGTMGMVASATFLDTSPGTGSVTYTLQVQRSGTGGATVGERQLIAFQFKKT